MYVIRDSEGKFVGRARSKANAHRATRRKNANHAIATKDRKFQQSDHFSAIVMGGRGDTIVVTYQGPSLSTARVKAKIAASQWQKPVSVIDDQWRTIATYQPDANRVRRNRTGTAPSSMRFSSLGAYQLAVHDRLMGKGLPRDLVTRVVDEDSTRIAMAMSRGKPPQKVADEIFGRVAFARKAS